MNTTVASPSSTEGHSAPKGRLRRGERGASLVEYALIVALLAVPTFGGIKMMQNAAASKISATAVGMSTHTIPSVP
ncbi:unannotated protein [freshwater metagenome]|uniref:Unannotated protein n=1 Tax=freshwater metagenome TaxID=449393 RepID=A0A6J6S0J8_9ZZZZ|nr:hypothetical protein [Actinomycetota bacterium]MSY78128.1 hypothetical protein [Actinomycetota bacterium]